MTRPSLEARQLVSLLGNLTDAALARAASEATWQYKRQKLTKERFALIMHRLQDLGWLGEVPDIPIIPEERFVIVYRCDTCGFGLSVTDKSTRYSEEEARIELMRHKHKRPLLHADVDHAYHCLGILSPIGLVPV